MKQKKLTFLIKFNKILIVFIYSFLINFGLMPSAQADRAEILSDVELDSISVGGFDFDLNAAYVFRSAVVEQCNIAGIAISDSTSSVNINATNKAMVVNEGNSAVSSQLNLNTVVAKSGDIVDTIINNLNISQVSNIFKAGEVDDLIDSVSSNIEEATSAITPEPEIGVQASNLSFVETAQPADTATDSLGQGSAAPEVTQASAPEVSLASIETPVPVITGTVNNVIASASAVAAQTNISALVALEGGISNARINNTNIACVENQGNAALATQTNIAIEIAKNDIKDSIVKNLNIANVVNKNTTEIGGAIANSLSLAGVVMNVDINNVIVENVAKASQVNITFIKSLAGDIKNNLIKELNLSRVINIP